MSKALQPGKQNGTLFADPIRASSQCRLHTKAEDKTAPDQHAETSNRCLQRGSHPDRTLVEVGIEASFGWPHPEVSRLSALGAAAAQSAAAKCVIWSACAFTKDGRAVARAT